MKTWTEVAKVQPVAGKIMTNSLLKERVFHSYLIQGEYGTRKDEIVLFFIKALLCVNKLGVDPCDQCLECKRIDSKNHPDVHWIEPAGSYIKKEQIDELQKEFSYSGLESNRKIYVIAGADRLTLNAANRLLKFMEEPSKQTTAFMLTDNGQAIIPTIRSRCQVIDLSPPVPEQVQHILTEHGMTISEARLMSAFTSDIDEALRLYQDEWFIQAQKLVKQWVEIYINKSEDVYLFLHQHWLPHFQGTDQLSIGLDLLLLTLKDILSVQINYNKPIVLYTVSEEVLNKMTRLFNQQALVASLQAVLEAKRKLRQHVNPTLVMEQLTLHLQR